MKYYIITETIDKKIIGSSNSPYTVIIESKDFIKYKMDKIRNIDMYFENKKNIYTEMPDNLCGKLNKRKGILDYMQGAPFCLSMVAVVSNKMRQVLEKLNISKNEYVLKKISIKGFSEDFYIMFVPFISKSELIISKCVFREAYGEQRTMVFDNYDEYESTRKKYWEKGWYLQIPKVTLKNKYSNYDILWPQGSQCFFSERVINAMREENIVGYDIITKGEFYSELYFASE